MKINCLSCGHRIELDDAYSDYEGPIRCFVCSASLEIKTEEGCLRWVKEAQPLVPVAKADDHAHGDPPDPNH
jgi:DNA-directed RNA polymerase subunit N (RpoN/RPB10)